MLCALVEEVRCQTEDDDCEDELCSAQDDGEEAKIIVTDVGPGQDDREVLGLIAADCSVVWRN
jgi:hypothetical protein